MRVLYTGGTGRVGVVVREGLAGRFDDVVLYSRRGVDRTLPGESVVLGEMNDIDALQEAMTGADVVVHLAGIPDEGSFEEILDVNIRGTYSVYEASRRAAVRRVVFASTNHVVGFYPVAMTVGIEAEVRPDSYYGVSKVFGEALGRLYYDKWGIESVCLRIGSFREEPGESRHLATWLSHRDGVELFRCAIESPGAGFVVLFGVSANDASFWRNGPTAQRIGFVPLDNSQAFAHLLGGEEGTARHHGGGFVDPDYRGGAWRTDLE